MRGRGEDRGGVADRAVGVLPKRERRRYPRLRQGVRAIDDSRTGLTPGDPLQGAADRSTPHDVAGDPLPHARGLQCFSRVPARGHVLSRQGQSADTGQVFRSGRGRRARGHHDHQAVPRNLCSVPGTTPSRSLSQFIHPSSAEKNTSAGAPCTAWGASLEVASKENRTVAPPCRVHASRHSGENIREAGGGQHEDLVAAALGPNSGPGTEDEERTQDKGSKDRAAIVRHAENRRDAHGRQVTGSPRTRAIGSRPPPGDPTAALDPSAVEPADTHLASTRPGTPVSLHERSI